MEGLLREVQNESWNGMIPAELSMDSSEVTSLQRPLTLYLLLPRMGFLPCIADAVSHHFGEVSPDAHRTLWLEDARSGEPLRWHIPTGALFDLIVGLPERIGEETGFPARNGGEVKGEGGVRSLLPWRITVHFQGCPRRQVFPLENEADMRRHYMNSLKQALYLQLGSSRVGMTLAKDNQTRLWHALRTNDAKVFHEMDGLFGGDGGLRVVPVRVLVGAAPPSQLPIPPLRPNGEAFTLRDCLCWCCPNAPWREPTSRSHARDPTNYDGTQESDDARVGIGTPLRDRKGESGTGEVDQTGATTDTVLAQAGKGVEPSQAMTMRGFDSEEGGVVTPKPPPQPQPRRLPLVLVQGVEVPLDASIARLWGALRHPDHFLYVAVRKRKG